MEETLPAPRTPEEDDIVRICAALNAEGALYIVVGGVAVNQQGFLRATEDIDLLLEDSKQNQASVAGTGSASRQGRATSRRE